MSFDTTLPTFPSSGTLAGVSIATDAGTGATSLPAGTYYVTIGYVGSGYRYSVPTQLFTINPTTSWTNMRLVGFNSNWWGPNYGVGTAISTDGMNWRPWCIYNSCSLDSNNCGANAPVNSPINCCSGYSSMSCGGYYYFNYPSVTWMSDQTSLIPSTSSSSSTGSTVSSTSTSTSSSSKKTSHIVMAIVVIAVVLAAGGGLGFYFWKKHKEMKMIEAK